MTVNFKVWGSDHWKTLMYLESRAVDYNGRIEVAHMRCDSRRHRRYAHMGSSSPCSPTRLRTGELLNHDDWDCVQDMIDLRVLELDERGKTPIVTLTDVGWRLAAGLRRHVGSGYAVPDFQPDRSSSAVMHNLFVAGQPPFYGEAEIPA